VAARAQVGSIQISAHRQLGAVQEWRDMRDAESAIVGNLEVVSGAAACLLLASDGQAGTTCVVGARGSKRQFRVDLVVDDSIEVVVERALDGTVEVALGHMEGELFAGESAQLGVKAELGAEATLRQGDDRVQVDLVSEVRVEIDVRLVIAPVDLHLVNVRHWDAVHGHGKAGGNLSNLAVLELAVESILAGGKGGLKLASSEGAGDLALVAGRDVARLQCTLGGELEAVALGSNLEFVVLMLESLFEEVIALL